MLLQMDLIGTVLVACNFVTMSFREDKSMPETHPGHLASLATESGSSTSKGSSFVKAIGGKARSLLKTLDRGFGPSITERDDEVSSMTIEFLYSRLRAQRMVHKAEKQRVQQLVKKVMELEQKLNLETARTKEAKCRDMVSSPRCRCYSLSKDFPHCKETACMMNKEVEGKRITTGISHFKDSSHYLTEHKNQHTGGHLLISGIENQIDGGGAHNTYGYEVSSMAQICFCHQCECYRSNCQGWSFEHCSPFDEQFNAPCSKSLMQKKFRENVDWGLESALHLKELKEDIMSEMTQMNLNAKDPYHDLDSWNKVCTYDHKETTRKKECIIGLHRDARRGLSHRFLCGYSPRTARSLWGHISNSPIESLKVISLDNPKSLSTEAISTEHLQKCSINKHAPGGQDEGALEGITNSPNKMNLGAFTGLSISSPISGHHKEILVQAGG